MMTQNHYFLLFGYVLSQCQLNLAKYINFINTELRGVIEWCFKVILCDGQNSGNEFIMVEVVLKG